MKKALLMMVVSLFTLGLSVQDADAKRLGGGSSIGKQRESISQQAAPKTPAAAPASAQPVQPAAAGGSRWLGPLAGLAAGGLLAALFMGGAFEGIKFADILMLVLLAAAVFFVVRMLRRRAEPARPMQYAGLHGQEPVLQPVPPLAGGGTPTVAPSYPAGFDPEPFLRQAKVAFIRLQAANDARDVNDIRDYTTPEMYAELAMQMKERGDAPQKTEVVTLNAELLEVVNEGDLAIASVRFSGLIRETEGGTAEPLSEIWHVQKNLKDPKSTWLLAGIQQVA